MSPDTAPNLTPLLDTTGQDRTAQQNKDGIHCFYVFEWMCYLFCTSKCGFVIDATVSVIFSISGDNPQSVSSIVCSKC